MAVVLYFLENIYWFFFGFLKHWYVDAPKKFFHIFLNFLQDADSFFAWRITIRNIFEPLYGDYSFIGYVLGFFFRFVRFIVGSISYLFLFLMALFCIFAWCVVPPLLLMFGIFPGIL